MQQAYSLPSRFVQQRQAKAKNAVRFVLILMAAALLFFALNTTIGGIIRDNPLYGVKDKYSFSPMEVTGLPGTMNTRCGHPK